MAREDAAAKAAPQAGGGRVARLDIHVGEIRQLFNSMDAAPFRERDLDPNAEQFIVEWGRETRADAPLALVVHLAREPAASDVESLRQAVREYFAHGAASARQRLRQLFRVGRWSLVIGVAFVAFAIFISDLVGGLVGRYNYGRLIEESIAIGAWVALWRPIEIFLYDWWPIRAEAKLCDRLSAMQVDIADNSPTVPAAT
jgi:hypothetical protein